ncbi:hypothetical protein ACSTB1_13245, partial [Faecalibacterium duncaniae]|uniref:hypothetical protein n=1 Tax=Faecalibacterium duncaniae (strain DSM 17677 / JCM 31915 / A2-165) TaxID=411483 RepID=UPI003EDABEC0
MFPIIFPRIDLQAFFVFCTWSDGTLCANQRKSPPGQSRQALPGRAAFYSFPHCLPVKNRRVVLARNTFPARRAVE